MHQVGVERVVAGDQHRERVLAGAPGPAGLLPQRGAGAGEAGEHARRRGRRRRRRARARWWRRGRAIVPSSQRALERAALLGQVAGAVGGDPAGQLPAPTSASARRAAQRHRLGAAPRPDEREGAHAVDDQVGEQVGGLGVADRRTGRAVLAADGSVSSGGSHSTNAAAPRGEASSVTAATSRPVSRRRDTAGSATVAEASTKTGDAP